MNQLLFVKNLSVSFTFPHTTMHIVRNLSFNVNRGETLGIVGESGCGKSMMAKSLIGLLPEMQAKMISGTVVYKGQDMLKKNQREMRSFLGKEISMVFQDPMASLNPTIKIGNQVGEGYKNHHKGVGRDKVKQRVITLLAQLGMSEPETRYHQYPHQLSGGMRQRVAIAIATITEPELLIADEPTTSLDATMRTHVLDMLKAIQKKRGMSMILITHDFSVVTHLCERIAVMYAGDIIETAPTQDLLKSPKHPYTRSLIDVIPRIDMPPGQSLGTVEGTPPDLSLTPLGCSFANRCPNVKQVCRSRKPNRVQLSKSRCVSCWLYDRHEARETP